MFFKASGYKIVISIAKDGHFSYEVLYFTKLPYLFHLKRGTQLRWKTKQETHQQILSCAFPELGIYPPPACWHRSLNGRLSGNLAWMMVIKTSFSLPSPVALALTLAVPGTPGLAPCISHWHKPPAPFAKRPDFVCKEPVRLGCNPTHFLQQEAQINTVSLTWQVAPTDPITHL